jgi:hypothetical protein
MGIGSVLGAVAGQEHSGQPLYGGLTGAGLTALSSMLRIPPSSLAMLASNVAANPALRRFFGYGGGSTRPTSPTEPVGAPNDPDSVNAIQQRESQGQQQQNKERQDFQQENQRYQNYGPQTNPNISPITGQPYPETQ